MIFEVNQVQHKYLVWEVQLFFDMCLFGTETSIFEPWVSLLKGFVYIAETNCIFFSDGQKDRIRFDLLPGI